jgi:polyphenol oxidase
MLHPMMAEALTSTVLQSPGIRHGFFTRKGGGSHGVYASLNCGPGSRDDADAVTANRRQVAAHLLVPADQLISPWQVHGATALYVTGPWAKAEERPRADALVSNTPGLAIGVLTADCAPVLFADAQARVVAAAHAGWKGALAGVVEATIATMEQAGAKRSRISAVVGPCIGKAAYEVGSEFHTAFISEKREHGRYFIPGNTGKYFFDLTGFVHDRLADAGIGTVLALNLCTYSEESAFYSFRRATHRSEADYGRQISAIVAD